MTEPSLGEVLRRVDEVSRQMKDIADAMTIERRENAATYLRRDLYEARHTALTKRMDGVESELADDRKAAADDRKAADNARRQFVIGLVLLAIPAIFGLVLAINNFLVTGGQTP